VTLDGSRTTSVSDISGSSSNVDTRFKARADYELLRDLILSVEGAHRTQNYTGIDRRDERWSTGLSAKWLVNRHASVVVNFEHTDQNSSGTVLGQRFSKNVVSAGIRLAI
jgi:hypothetical protein